jgi:hypothetical protein
MFMARANAKHLKYIMLKSTQPVKVVIFPAAFQDLSLCLAQLEKMDPNTSRFLKLQRMAEDTFACYREIYEEKKKVGVQVSLDRFEEGRAT